MIGSIEKILQDPSNRLQSIKLFQNKIWDSDGSGYSDDFWEILSGLAYDLDFYQPSEFELNPWSGYYGDDQLERNVRAALAKIKELTSRRRDGN